MMTTAYFICVRCAADLDHARREHRRVAGRGAFSPRRNFLPTCIRQRLHFRVLGRALPLAPLSTVLLAVLSEAPLITSARSAATGCAGLLATRGAAVVLPAIVWPADEEPHGAPPAHQLVDRNSTGVVQGSGCDRQKLGCGPEPCDDCRVGSPALGLRPKARARDSGLHFFRCASIIRSSSVAGHFSAGGPLVPGEGGGSGPLQARW
jgi:hypothetical protein